MRKSLVCFFLIAIACFVTHPVSAKANPPEIRNYFGQAKPLGYGTFHWFTFKVYDAELWSVKQPWSINGKYALRLKYARDFSREDLVKSSLEEIERIKSADDKKLAYFEGALNKMFPNVKKGDTITAINLPEKKKVELYYNGKLYADNTDPNFYKDFFAIWLDPKTQAKELREKLIAQAESE